MAPAVCAGELRAMVKDMEGKPVADAVVVVTPNGTAAGEPKPAIVDQVDKEFVPYVMPILAGSEVSFPNKDNIHHQVYSFSPAKRFELPLYKADTAPPVLFDQPGVVTLGCNIHDWMIGYIYVSESPWFARTEADGTATVANLPEGTYRARIWHPHIVESEQDTALDVTVTGGGGKAEWQVTLKPDLRPRRAPLGKERGY